VDLHHFFFKNRSYTPVPLIIIILILAQPSWLSFLLGLAVALLGESIRFWGVAYAGSATRTTGRAGGARLITDGPFGLVRNPLYVGNFFLSLGVVIMCWAWMPWMVLVHSFLFSLQYYFIVRHEEEYLAHTFPEYKEYRRQVHRWIPRLSPCQLTDQIRTQPNYPKALRSERNTLQAIVAVSALILIRWYLL